MRATVEQIKKAANAGMLEALLALMKASDTGLVQGSLEALDRLLLIGCAEDEMDNTFAHGFKELGGDDTLAELASHANIEIHRTAERLFDDYFSEETEEGTEQSY